MSKAITDIDSLFDATMDDIDDLPPVGVPPTGHYNLCISAERVDPDDGRNSYVKFSYEVEAVNEVRDPAEESEAAIGMKFSQIFSPMKKDGTVNDYGIAFLKEAVAPFSAHFDEKGIGNVIAMINKVSVAATLVRRKDKKDPERFNFNLKDVVVL